VPLEKPDTRTVTYRPRQSILESVQVKPPAHHVVGIEKFGQVTACRCKHICIWPHRSHPRKQSLDSKGVPRLPLIGFDLQCNELVSHLGTPSPECGVYAPGVRRQQRTVLLIQRRKGFTRAARDAKTEHETVEIQQVVAEPLR
jgi:hypothetical protein